MRKYRIMTDGSQLAEEYLQYINKTGCTFDGSYLCVPDEIRVSRRDLTTTGEHLLLVSPRAYILLLDSFVNFTVGPQLNIQSLYTLAIPHPTTWSGHLADLLLTVNADIGYIAAQAEVPESIMRRISYHFPIDRKSLVRIVSTIAIVTGWQYNLDNVMAEVFHASY